LTVSTSAACPNECTHRGQCTANACTCPTGYTGDYCQTRTAPLTDGIVENGYVKYNAWNYYNYISNSIDYLTISVAQQGGTGDCDLYVRAGQNPSRVNYDYYDIGTSQQFNLTINDPGSTTWYIGVYGWSECTYNIQLFESDACPYNCNGRGTCDSNSNVCICNAGWTGIACESALAGLQNGIIGTGSVTENNWNYYSYSVTNSGSLHVLLKETSTSGALWLYVAKTYPTIRSYLYADTETNTNIHILAIDLDEDETAVYQIGVYGNPYLLENQVGTYQLIAWAPDF